MGTIRIWAVTITIGLVVVLLTPRGAAAQAPPILQPCPCLLAQAPGGLPAESLALRLDTLPGYVSPDKAFNYSLLGTVLPVATLVAAYPGFLFGPSLGYFHAGQPGRAWTGIGIRALATGGMVSAFVICGWDCGKGDSAYDIAWVVLLASSGTFVGSAIYDIATVKGAVRRQNERLNVAWSISPRYAANRGEVGLQLRLTF